MKRIIYVLIGLLFITACNNSNRIEISGTIENGNEKELKFSELLVSGTQDIDKVKLDEKGNFKFKTTTDFPRFYQISVSSTNFITLLIEPGEKVRINADINNLGKAVISGSEEAKLVQKLNNDLAATKIKLNALKKEAEMVSGNAEKIEEINQEYANIVNQQRDSSIAFIINHLNSLASIVALYQKYDDQNYVLYKNKDLQYIKIVSEALGKKYPESPHVKALLADHENLMKKYNLLKSNLEMSKLIENKKVYNYPEILLPDQSGDSISLNQVRSKYLLLSFWASWSQESLQRNIELLEIYKKYHTKGFEIYEVSLDTKKENWIKAINFDQLPWINVIDTDGRMSYFAKIYNVKTLPTSFLINPDGDIISINPSKEQLTSTFEYALK